MAFIITYCYTISLLIYKLILNIYIEKGYVIVDP